MKNLYIIILLFGVLSCKNSKEKIPDKYINNVNVDPELYKKDKFSILDSLYAKLKRHESSFSNSEYFDSTLLIIDSIIYEKSLNKVAIFVVAKNPTYRNRFSFSKVPFYYNAYCYLGKRVSANSNKFNIECLCRFSEINFEDKETVIKALREDFFIELATVLDENGKPVFKFNLNDTRFWDSTLVWNEMFE